MAPTTNAKMTRSRSQSRRATATASDKQKRRPKSASSAHTPDPANLASIQSTLTNIAQLLAVHPLPPAQIPAASNNQRAAEKIHDADDTENLSPPKAVKKQKKSRPNRRNKKTRQYEEQQLADAIKKVENGDMGRREAARLYKVPYATLSDKLRGEQRLANGEEKALFCTRGTEPFLSKDVEDILVEYLEELDSRGFPLNCQVFLSDIPSILREAKVPNPFEKKVPSEAWFYSRFKKRHPNLAMHTPQAHSKSRANVTVDEIYDWFNEVEKYLADESLLDHFKQHPEVVFNMDETAMYLNDTRGKVIGRKGRSSQIVINGSEKENVTVAVTVSAAGELLFPFIVLKKSQKLRDNFSLPEGFKLDRTRVGWMESGSMLNYLRHFHSECLRRGFLDPPESNTKRVYLLVDGHSSHVSFAASKFAQKRGIVLICLFANSTHILQPNDVLIMSALKSLWRSELRDFKHKHPHERITIPVFMAQLKRTFDQLKLEGATIRKAFRVTGLHPFDKSALDTSKLLSSKRNEVPSVPEIVLQSELQLKTVQLREFEAKLSKEELTTFQTGKGSGRLFEIWKSYGGQEEAEVQETCSQAEIGQDVEPDDEENDEDPWSVETPQVATTFDPATGVVSSSIGTLGEIVYNANVELVSSEFEAGEVAAAAEMDALVDAAFDDAASENLNNSDNSSSSSLDILRKLNQRKRAAELRTLGNVIRNKIPVAAPSQAKRRMKTTHLVSTDLYRTTKKNQEDLDQDSDWLCHVCFSYWSLEDADEKAEGKAWTECDTCENKVHVACVKTEHAESQNLVSNLELGKLNPDFTYEFICSTCCEEACCM